MLSDKPKRLNNRSEPVGLHKNFSPRGMFLFGLPFLGVGIWIMLVGLEIVEVDSSKVHAPMWVLTVVGLIFAASGCLVWNMGWQQAKIRQRLKRLAAQYPGDTAMADYPWDRNGYSPPRWKPVRKAWSALIFMAVFSSVFNWWAFGSGNGPLPVQIGIGILDLVLLGVLLWALKTTWHAVKFGKTQLNYDHFPYRPGERAFLEIQLPASLRNGQSATLTLRQILEYYEITGSGKNRNKRLVHEVKYSEEQTLTQNQIAEWPGYIRTLWDLPKIARATQLSADQPLFWELELELDVPGLDLKQRYLLPVYGE